MRDHVSRSEKKRQAQGIEDIARELIELSSQERSLLPVGAKLAEAIAHAAKLDGGALRRQTKFIAKTLREEPIDDIITFLDQKKGLKLRQSQDEKYLVRLRNGIVRDALDTFLQADEERFYDHRSPWPSPHLEEAIKALPELAVEEIRIAAYRHAVTGKPVHKREIFRLLKATMEKTKFQSHKEEADK